MPVLAQIIGRKLPFTENISLKILIIGVINSINFGDPILTECVRRLVREKAPGADIRLGDINGGKPEAYIREIVYKSAAAGASASSATVMPKASETEEGGRPHPAEEPENQSREPLPSLTRLKFRQLKYRCRTLITKSGIRDLEYERQNSRLQKAIPAIREMLSWQPDLVIFAGGQILCDWYGLQTAAIIHMLGEKQVPVVLTSCGTGPDTSVRIRNELITALNAPVVRFISLRDGMNKVQNWGISRPLYDAADAALWTGPLFAGELSDTVSAPAAMSQRPVGIGVIYSMSAPVCRELRFLKQLTSYLDRSCVPWQFFGNGSAEDLCMAETALEKCVPSEEERKQHMADWPERPEDLIRLESGFRGIISFRLHSHIVAASFGVPSVAIRWDDKLPGFFGKIGSPERCLELSAPPELVWRTFLQAEKDGYHQQKLDDCRQRVDCLLDRALEQVGE